MVIARRLLITLLLLHAVPGRAAMQVAGEVPLPYAPSAVAVDPVARKAFLVRHDHAAAAVTVVELDSMTIRSFDAARFPYRMLVDTARGRLYVTHHDEAGAGLLSVVNAETERVIAQAPIGRYPDGIAADFARREFYVANTAQGGLWVIDADRLDVLAKIAVGQMPAGIAVDRARRRLVVGSGQIAGNRYAVVDLDARAVAAFQPVRDEGLFFDAGPDTPIIDERSGSAFLAHGSGELDLLDPPDYAVANHLTEGWGTYYGLGYNSDQPTTSLAWRKLYQVGYRMFQDTARPVPYQWLRSIDGRSGASSVRTLADSADDWRLTLLVDDDGGDLYVTTGGHSRRLLRIDPESLAVRETLDLPGFVAELSFRDPTTRRIFLAGSDDSGNARLVAIETSGAKAGTRIATGFRHKAFDHHFVTADPTERRLIDDGRFGSDWQVTDDVFRVWSQPIAGSVPVCRFFSARFAPRSSHFYTPYAAECDALKQAGDWQFEGIAFHVALPDTAGTCAAGTEPLYRVYNEGGGGAPNHRYTASTQAVAEMTAKGWTAEGVGPGRVFACTPTLR